MSTRVVVDPVTRIEGHLRVEAMLDDSGIISDAISSGTMWRGIEVILQGRDPRDAWAFCERICGVCTTVHALASVRAVESALGITMPKNAEIIRNIMELAQYVQDHVIHFYHLHALDWVDVVSALKADPAATAALAQKVSPHWPTSTPGYYSDTAATLKKFVESGQLGIFQNAYWGHPAYKLPPEANLMAVAHYLEALEVAEGDRQDPHRVRRQKSASALPGGRNRRGHQPEGRQRHQHGAAEFVRGLILDAQQIVEGLYLPDLLAVASFYPEWTKIGGGLGNYHGLRRHPAERRGRSVQVQVPARRDPQQEPGRGSAARSGPIRLRFRSRSRTPGTSIRTARRRLHPSEGHTEPSYNGPKPPFHQLDENGGYSWVKAPRWKGQRDGSRSAGAHVGRLCKRHATSTRKSSPRRWAALKLEPAALFSTLGRTAARGLETQLAVKWLLEEYDRLIANLKAGDIATADTTKWEPKTWPADCKGFGVEEAPRGAARPLDPYQGSENRQLSDRGSEHLERFAQGRPGTARCV